MEASKLVSDFGLYMSDKTAMYENYIEKISAFFRNHIAKGPVRPYEVIKNELEIIENSSLGSPKSYKNILNHFRLFLEDYGYKDLMVENDFEKREKPEFNSVDDFVKSGHWPDGIKVTDDYCYGLNLLTQELISDNFKENEIAKRYSASTVNRLSQAYLNYLLEFHRQWIEGVSKLDLVYLAREIYKTKEKHAVLSYRQLETAFEKLKEESDRAIMTLIVYDDMLSKHILLLLWEDIDFHKNTINVPSLGLRLVSEPSMKWLDRMFKYLRPRNRDRVFGKAGMGEVNMAVKRFTRAMGLEGWDQTMLRSECRLLFSKAASNPQQQ